MAEQNRQPQVRPWQQRADDLSAQAIAAGKPTAWFDQLYAEGRRGEVPLPWDRGQPNPPFVEWVREQSVTGAGRRAVVVGCSLGQDSEYVGELGFDTTAFDVSPTAVSLVRERFPESPVHYEVANLLDLPARWRQAFDLVVEIYTVQAMPAAERAAATASVAGLVAPGGTLFVIASARADGAALPPGPPWPLDRAELDDFAGGGLTPVRVALTGPPPPVWRAEFRAAQ
jgi:SAM-dependent methyltransferase